MSKTTIILFSDVLNMWLNSNKVHIKQSSFDKYNHIIEKHIIPVLGQHTVKQIDSVVLNDFLYCKLSSGELKKGDPLSASYVSTMSLILSSAMHFAANEGFCRSMKNPILKPSVRKKTVSILNKKDSLKLTNHIFNNCDGTGLGILLSLYMGLRIGEVCALRWEHIDFKRKTLFIDSTVSRIREDGKTKYVIQTPKTESSIRVIPIPKIIYALLENEHKTKESEFVISNKKTFVIPRTFEYRYHKILKQLNIEPINFHSLRHTFATVCIANGMDVKSLSEILGHASINTTMQIYVHPSIDTKRRQINKVFQ